MPPLLFLWVSAKLCKQLLRLKASIVVRNFLCGAVRPDVSGKWQCPCASLNFYLSFNWGLGYEHLGLMSAWVPPLQGYEVEL